MTTIIIEKPTDLLELIESKEKDDIAVLSNNICGTISGCTKKKRYKTIEFGLPENLFKSPDTIHDLISSKAFVLLIINKKHLKEVKE